MAVNPADMESCNIKNTCVGGVNDGVAYDPGSPCGGAANVAFNPVSCDCEETTFCANGDCGWDVEWEVTSENAQWSIRPCNAPSCVIDCSRDTYRLCGYYTPTSGSFYLSPGKCLREVRQETNGPCAGVGESAPAGGFIREDWYTCDPDVVDPKYQTCGTPVAQMPGGGYCSTVLVGPGIVETGRVQRVKKALQSRINFTSVVTKGASCGACDSTISYSSTSDVVVSWHAAVEDNVAAVRFSSISPACDESATCPGSYASELGINWLSQGTFLSDASQTKLPCGVSDGLMAVATIAVSSGNKLKGQKIGYLLSLGWAGAVGCSQEGLNSMNSVATTVFNCYKPEELV